MLKGVKKTLPGLSRFDSVLKVNNIQKEISGFDLSLCSFSRWSVHELSVLQSRNDHNAEYSFRHPVADCQRKLNRRTSCFLLLEQSLIQKDENVSIELCNTFKVHKSSRYCNLLLACYSESRELQIVRSPQGIRCRQEHGLWKPNYGTLGCVYLVQI